MTNGVGVGRYWRVVRQRSTQTELVDLESASHAAVFREDNQPQSRSSRGLGTIQSTSSLHNHNKTYIKLHVDDCDASHPRSFAPLGVQFRHQPQAANSRAGRAQTIPQPCSLVLHAAGYIGHILRNLSPITTHSERTGTTRRSTHEIPSLPYLASRHCGLSDCSPRRSGP